MNSIVDHNLPDLQGATLEWGIKESFRTYFERLPDHRYELSGGARRHGDGQIEFGGNLEPSDGYRYVFGGTVQLKAHFDALSVKIANPVIERDGDAGTVVLTAEVDEQDGVPVRMTIAQLHLDSTAPDNLTFRAELAGEGQYLFMGNYFAGDPMDPVRVWFRAA